MGSSAQLLPVTIDFLFPPLATTTGYHKALLDVGRRGIIVNTLVFIVDSKSTTNPDSTHLENFARDLETPAPIPHSPNHQIP